VYYLDSIDSLRKNKRSSYWRAIHQGWYRIDNTSHHKREPVEWVSRFDAMHVAAGNALGLRIPTPHDIGQKG
jgi:hypothetical protein